jgi:hypothetical protein
MFNGFGLSAYMRQAVERRCWFRRETMRLVRRARAQQCGHSRDVGEMRAVMSVQPDVVVEVVRHSRWRPGAGRVVTPSPRGPAAFRFPNLKVDADR